MFTYELFKAENKIEKIYLYRYDICVGTKQYIFLNLFYPT